MPGDNLQLNPASTEKKYATNSAHYALDLNCKVTKATNHS